MDLAETSCVSCGQCIAVCPTGAIYEKDNTEEVFAAIADPEKYVVVQCAPAVRAGLGEAFGMPIGTDVEGKLAAALRRLGFDKVFDTDFSADLTIMEEASELVERITEKKKPLPGDIEPPAKNIHIVSEPVSAPQLPDGEPEQSGPEEPPAQPRDDETPPPQDGEGPNEKPEQDRP